MGRGKKAKADKHKKDAKPQEGEGEEEVTRGLTEMSLDPQPSTSVQTPIVPEEPNPPPKSEAESKPAPNPEEEEDDGGLGLGLGKSRKKRPNKKKKAAENVSAPTQGIDKQGSGDRPPSGSLPGGPGAAAAGAAAPPPWGARPQASPGLVPAQPAAVGAPPGFQTGPQAGYTVPRQQPAVQGFPVWQSSGPPPAQRQPVTTPTGPPPQARAGSIPPQAQSMRGPPPQTPSTSGLSTVAASGDVRRSSAESRYRIPDKVPSRNAVKGTVMRVITNYLEMTIKPVKIHRYDVTFMPDKPKKAIPKAFAIAKAKLGIHQSVAFDQMKNCYSLKPLPTPKGDRIFTNVDVLDNNGRNMHFEVSFKATGIIDVATIINHMKNGGSSLNPPTECIQCIDVILRQGTLENYIKAGRQFFKRPSRPINLGDGLEMWTGLFQSAIFTNRAFINIDVAHKGFPKQQKMIDALTNDFRMDPRNPIDVRSRSADAFFQFIKGLRVLANVGGDSSSKGQKREFICNELVDPPNKISFTMTDAEGKQTTMTVLDYFQRVKGVRLQYPNLNCMWVGVKDKKIYYPLELLEISYGQALNKQLNENQLTTMVREAATPPDERKRKIDEVIADMNYSRNTYFKEFGLDINNTFFEVEAKVLDPPNLDCGGNRAITPQKGQWQAQRLLKPEALEAWALIAIEMDMRQSNGEQIVELLVSIGRQIGMSPRDPLERYYNTPMHALRDTLYRALAKNCKFIVIIVPTRGRDYYHRVKQIAERDVGVLTQCIKEYTATRRMNPQTARNILLKMNSKLMGINQALDRRSMPACLGGGVMVVGADVTHPSPDQSSVPSIAAVTASIDPRSFFLYNIQLSIQTPKKEMIVEFEEMMLEHFKVYLSKTGALPRKIFVFRDGVSEGQFAQVMHSELQAVHRAYQRMSGDPQKKPEVLFLLVQKRHHTRFFHKDPRQAQFNVMPGTVVDKDIVHPKELDFYLVSHQAIKGTARPTRYHAVCNDGKIPHDEVEQLTFYLCHLYSRCMRSVSYPTPTYYAHLACLRARSLTYGEKFNNQDLERTPKRLNVLDRMLDTSRMFFV